ncbi:HAD-IA family hydrolase [Candidatus Binatia bacterium]|nr:HAD-IA family hydrolase [Candidatus Binatia bacterium]
MTRRDSGIAAVSFDAGGTLIGIVEPVGATYARFARQAGFTADADVLDEGFRRAFTVAPPLAPPADHAGPLLEFELRWWRAIVAASLAHALGDDAVGTHGDAFERFFAATFAYYAEPTAWRVLPDACDTVRELHGRGLTLAVLSNFDARLHGLIAQLGFGAAFTAIVPSSEAGAAKPSPGAFMHLRRRVAATTGTDLPPTRWLHVGDSLHEDVAGARAAGWHAAWIDRDGRGDGAATLPPGASRLTDLRALAQLLDQGSTSG